MNFKQSPNYSKGTIKKTGFVLHGTLGGYVGAVEWLTTGNRPNPSSSHYVIGREEGKVTQLVKNEDVAWHCGTVRNPHPRALANLMKHSNGSFINPNSYLIGIEFEWGVGQTLTDWQYRCAIQIIKDSGIANPTNSSHHDICDYKSDDMAFAFERIWTGIKQVGVPYTPSPKPVNNFQGPIVYGMQSADVWWLQYVLQYEGCLANDYHKSGKYDMPTAMAVKKLQEKHKIASQAIINELGGKRVGALTINYLNKKYGY